MSIVGTLISLSYTSLLILQDDIIYYCMTGRAIWGNIQLEGGSIGPSAARDNTEPES